jgi:hypothetical protein
MQTKVEKEYLAVREQLAKTLQVIEGKENAFYATLADEFEITNIRRHGECAPILDSFGLASGD